MRLGKFALSAALLPMALAIGSVPLHAQSDKGGFGVCRPVSQRKSEIGCWILTDHKLGGFEQPKVFWELDAYPTRAAADKAKGPGGTVLESLGKTWLLTVEARKQAPGPGGKRVAEIGPIDIKPGLDYSALYMEAIMTPGMTSTVHRHSGPEAWYTMSGETCLETPQGKFVGSPGANSVIVPAGPPMLLTATGKKERRAIVLILHDASQAPTFMEHEWKPKGLCK